MLIIQNDNLSPYFNIASEEYLLKNFEEDIFMLYINNPSIIVGKHQNALAEINFPYVHQNQIPVVRRLSGGGTVYHDEGNLNFAFIQNGSEGNLVNFKKFTEPVIGLLQSLGVDARFEGKNDLRINGLKISGNAEHVFRKRVIHHGTLLFNSDLKNLRKAIKITQQKYIDKAVQSIRSHVTNIKPLLKERLTTNQFKKKIEGHVKNKTDDWKEYQFTKHDLEQINKLQKEKFKTWEWNFGYSPSYVFYNTIQIKSFQFDIKLWVEKGRIKKYKNSSIKGEVLNEDIFKGLNGTYHKIENISEIVSKINADSPKNEESFMEMVYQFF